MKIRLTQVWGFAWAVTMSRLSRLSVGDSVIMSDMDDLGVRDLELARKLVKRNETKFLEHVCVWYTITATRGFWQQESTYRIGISRLSESTSYCALDKLLTQNDFAKPINEQTLVYLNQLIETKDQEQLEIELPEGYLQTRGIRASYAVLRHMYHQRRNHRRSEWQEFCNWCETLPYSWLITLR